MRGHPKLFRFADEDGVWRPGRPSRAESLPHREHGQAAVLFLVALSIFLFGAVGLAIDGSHMFAQRQMAQAAADAAAQAAIMSIFDGTNGSGTHAFSTASAFTCTSVNPTPCYYAQSLNGFGAGTDTVTVDFPSAADAGVDPSKLSSDPVNLVRVTVQRSVNTTLMRFVGPSSSMVRASAVAAIVELDAPVPIVVLHPTKAGSFSKNGTNTITICGGPSKSIQVNSSNSGSVDISGGSGTVDLSHAGPLDTAGNCTTGTGANFGNFGGPTTYPGTILLGTLPGQYVQPASPLKDPLAGIAAPTEPGDALSPVTLNNGPTPTDWGCPANTKCVHYFPGRYNSQIEVKGSEYALFDPGIYYVKSGGFNMRSNSAAAMVPSTCSSCTAPPTGFTTRRGMLVFNSGNAKDDIINFDANAGTYNNLGISLVGADEAGTYKGILFFQDRLSGAHNDKGSLKGHTISGGATLTLVGTIYTTNTLATMTGDPDHFQAITLSGNAGSTTKITGQIITDTLSLGGGPSITMNLNSGITYKVRQVGLVK